MSIHGFSNLRELPSDNNSYNKKINEDMKPFLEVIHLNSRVGQLEKLVNFLYDRSKNNPDIVTFLDQLKRTDADLYGKIAYLVWNAHLSFRDLDQNGAAVLAENPRILLLAKNAEGIPLLDQMIVQFRQAAAVKQFKNILAVSKTLTKDFLDLPVAFQDLISHKVWQADGSPSRYNYGKDKIVANPQILLSYKGNQQKHLLDATIEEFIDIGQKKICVAYISETAAAVADSPKTVKMLQFQGELERFYAQIKEPSKTKEELVQAFKKLDLKLQGTLSFYVWICLKKPNTFGIGQRKIEENPRLFLGLMDSSKKNIIEALIEHQKTKVAYERNIAQVERFLVLLIDPKSSLRAVQDAFRLLDPLSKNRLADEISAIDEQPNHNRYGIFKIQRDPRILLNYRGRNLVSELVQSLKDTSRHALRKAKYNNGQELGDVAVDTPGDVSIARLIKSLPPETLIEQWSTTIITVEFDKVINQGGLAVAPYGLAEGLCARGHKVSIILPKYDIINNVLVDSPDDAFQDVQGKTHRVFTCKIGEFACYFIEDERFNIGRNDDGTPKKIYGPDNRSVLDRFGHFSSLAADLSYKMYQKKETQIIHCQDWHSGLVPKLIASRHPKEWTQGLTPPVVFTVHNNISQGVFNPQDGSLQSLKEMGLKEEETNAMVEGLLHMDAGTAVSRTFAGVDAQGKALGMGIEHFFRASAHQGTMTGIVNGANTSKFNTQTDAVLKNWKDPITFEPIDLTFGPDDDIVAKKALIKHQLQQYYLLHRKDAILDLVNKPLILFLGRYDSFQKGTEMLEPAMESALKNNAEFIAIGIDPDDPAKEHLAKLGEKITEISEGVGASVIDDKKRMDGRREVQDGHGIGPLLRAAADFTLVPSRLEPCGLVQLEAMLHASLPICTKIGGLADTIITDGDRKNGFLFERLENWHSPEQKELVKKAVEDAIKYWSALTKNQKNQRLKSVVNHAKRSGWAESADESLPPVDQYRHVYASALVNAQKRKVRPSFINHFLKA